MKLRLLLCLGLTMHVLLGGVVPQAYSQEPAQASIVRFEKGYRYPQAGWIVLHIEGNSYERGFQHGRLLAPEIASYLRCFARTLNDKAPNETWQHIRTLVNSIFLRKFDKEYLEEMKGIADGATKAGARIYGQVIDLVDMDDFGMRYGGQRVTSEQFQKHMEGYAHRTLDPFFNYWLHETGLPR